MARWSSRERSISTIKFQITSEIDLPLFHKVYEDFEGCWPAKKFQNSKINLLMSILSCKLFWLNVISKPVISFEINYCKHQRTKCFSHKLTLTVLDWLILHR